MDRSMNMRDVVVVAVLSVVFGILYFWWVPVGRIAAGAGGPLARAPLFGFWLIAAVVAGYIVQKPGAALIAEIVASFVEALVGSTAGLSVLGWGLVQGGTVELVFLAMRYRNFSAPVLMLAGGLSAAAAFVYQGITTGYVSAGLISTELLVGVLVVQVLSGAVLAGLGGKALAEALAATGVINGYALGRQWVQRRRLA